MPEELETPDFSKFETKEFAEKFSGVDPVEAAFEDVLTATQSLTLFTAGVFLSRQLQMEGPSSIAYGALVVTIGDMVSKELVEHLRDIRGVKVPEKEREISEKESISEN